MSTTFIAQIVQFLAWILPAIGITVGSDALTTTISTIALVGTGVWVFIGRWRAGGISIFGFRKN